jgi:hypothetical protein
MAVRGEIVVECDKPECHAEIVLGSEVLRVNSVEDALWDADWKVAWIGLHVCPQCIEDGK